MITLITGPMYGGKSTTLVQKMERYLYAKKKVLFVRPKKDDRGYITHGGLVKWEGEVKPDILEIEEWTPELLGILDKYSAVFVDEYFMIKGNIKVCQHVSDKKYDLYFAGLLATSENKLVSEAIDILPYCDDIIKLNGVCMICGSQHGNYSMYNGTKTEEIVVGDKVYQCVCRRCYKKTKGIL